MKKIRMVQAFILVVALVISLVPFALADETGTEPSVQATTETGSIGNPNAAGGAGTAENTQLLPQITVEFEDTGSSVPVDETNTETNFNATSGASSKITSRPEVVFNQAVMPHGMYGPASISVTRQTKRKVTFTADDPSAVIENGDSLVAEGFTVAADKKSASGYPDIDVTLPFYTLPENPFISKDGKVFKGWNVYGDATILQPGENVFAQEMANEIIAHFESKLTNTPSSITITPNDSRATVKTGSVADFLYEPSNNSYSRKADQPFDVVLPENPYNSLKVFAYYQIIDNKYLPGDTVTVVGNINATAFFMDQGTFSIIYVDQASNEQIGEPIADAKFTVSDYSYLNESTVTEILGDVNWKFTKNPKPTEFTPVRVGSLIDDPDMRATELGKVLWAQYGSGALLVYCKPSVLPTEDYSDCYVLEYYGEPGYGNSQLGDYTAEGKHFGDNVVSATVIRNVNGVGQSASEDNIDLVRVIYKKNASFLLIDDPGFLPTGASAGKKFVGWDKAVTVDGVSKYIPAGEIGKSFTPSEQDLNDKSYVTYTNSKSPPDSEHNQFTIEGKMYNLPLIKMFATYQVKDTPVPDEYEDAFVVQYYGESPSQLLESTSFTSSDNGCLKAEVVRKNDGTAYVQVIYQKESSFKLIGDPGFIRTPVHQDWKFAGWQKRLASGPNGEWFDTIVQAGQTFKPGAEQLGSEDYVTYSKDRAEAIIIGNKTYRLPIIQYQATYEKKNTSNISSEESDPSSSTPIGGGNIIYGGGPDDNVSIFDDETPLSPGTEWFDENDATTTIIKEVVPLGKLPKTGVEVGNPVLILGGVAIVLAGITFGGYQLALNHKKTKRASA